MKMVKRTTWVMFEVCKAVRIAFNWGRSTNIRTRIICIPIWAQTMTTTSCQIPTMRDLLQERVRPAESAVVMAAIATVGHFHLHLGESHSLDCLSLAPGSTWPPSWEGPKTRTYWKTIQSTSQARRKTNEGRRGCPNLGRFPRQIMEWSGTILSMKWTRSEMRSNHSKM